MGYTLKSKKTKRNEGQSITFTFKASNEPKGTIFYWGLSGSGINKEDFKVGTLLGQGKINKKKKFNITHTIDKDKLTEGDETVDVSIYKTISRLDKIVSSSYKIIDTSKTITQEYSVSTNKNTFNEGETITSTITTKGVKRNTTLYWSLSGAITASDLSKGKLLGTVKVNKKNKMSFTHKIKEDFKKEGQETAFIKVFSDKERLNEIGFKAISIMDTSLPVDPNDPPTYLIQPVVNTVNEGGQLKFSIKTTNVPNKTNFYWKLSGNGIDKNDISGSLTGKYVVGKTRTIKRKILKDGVSEGFETVLIDLYEDSLHQKKLVNTAFIKIRDDKNVDVSPSIYSIANAEGNEGDKIISKITRSGNINSTDIIDIKHSDNQAFRKMRNSVYWDFTAPIESVTFAPGEKYKNIIIQTNEDKIPEPKETFYLHISSSSQAAKITRSTAKITIIDDDKPEEIISIVNNPNKKEHKTIQYKLYKIDTSSNYNIYVEDATFIVKGDSSNSGSNKALELDFRYLGTNQDDSLKQVKVAAGKIGSHDYLVGNGGNDHLRGLLGRDVIDGGEGDDSIRAGGGHDIIDGGDGKDILYGGVGQNVFNNNRDGEVDKIFIQSDYHGHVSVWGRFHDGRNADIISSLGEEDEVTILGVPTSELHIQQLTDGLGIFASGSLEAVLTDDSWTKEQLENNVYGDASRYF